MADHYPPRPLYVRKRDPVAAWCQKYAYISDTMQRLTDEIMAHVGGLPEGRGIAAKALLHLGNRAAVDQALSRLVRRGRPNRVGRGLYLPPVLGRFGTRAPSIEEAVRAIGARGGEIIAPTGATAANKLGLTTQAPVQSIYLTSGRSRTISFGKQTLEFRHVPGWQTVLSDRPAGDAIRALGWLGPERAEAGLATVKARLALADLSELAASAPQLLSWLTRCVTKCVSG